MIPDAFVTLGLGLPLIVVFWIVVGFAVVTALSGFFWWMSMDSLSGWGILTWMTGGVTALVAILLVIFLVPFDSKYWHYYKVEGTIENVSNVWDEGSGDITRVPIVTLDSVDRPLVVDDPRVVELEGSEVTLRCSIGWHYQAADTYDCILVEYSVR